MRNLVLKIIGWIQKHAGTHIGNQDGSIIVVAMMLLLLMTLIGISGTRTSITESFIVRNVATYDQNVNLLEAAALEVAQRTLINIGEPANPWLAEASPVKEPWIIPDSVWNISTKRNDWYNITTSTGGRVLTGTPVNVTDSFGNVYLGSSSFPQWIEPLCVNQMTIVDDVRGEANAPVRAALVGWDAAPGSSLKLVKATRKRARIIAEYVSPEFGMSRLELGVERQF